MTERAAPTSYRGPRGVRRFRSLRIRAFAAVLLVLALPLVFVYGSVWLEGGVGARMLEAVTTSAASAAQAGSETADPEALEKALDEIASLHHVRIRFVDRDGSVRFDIDRERASTLARKLGAIFFGADDAPSLATFDASLQALFDREEVIAAHAGGVSEGCRTSEGRKLLVCDGVGVDAVSGMFVYV